MEISTHKSKTHESYITLTPIFPVRRFKIFSLLLMHYQNNINFFQDSSILKIIMKFHLFKFYIRDI